MTPERFAQGMTFDDYVTFTGSAENLAREGFDIRRFSMARPRLDWSAFLRKRHTEARLTPDQIGAIQWLAAQPGGPAKVAVISEDWSSDCRRDVPYLARLAKAGASSCASSSGTATPCCSRACPTRRRAATPTWCGPTRTRRTASGGHRSRWRCSSPRTSPSCTATSSTPRSTARTACWATCARRAGRAPEQAKARAGAAIGELLESPFYDVWAQAAIAEILSALHERLLIPPQPAFRQARKNHIAAATATSSVM